MTVGRTMVMAGGIVSIDSAKTIVTPWARYTYDTSRSKEWLSGRYESDTSSSLTGTTEGPAARVGGGGGGGGEVGEGVGVRDHPPLRTPGRAGRVDDGRQIGGADRPRLIAELA